MVKKVINKITDGFAESTRAVHEINKENIAAVKAESRAFHEQVTAPDPAFVEFKQTKGIKNKAKVVAKAIKENAETQSEKEKERRADIMSFDSYRTLLDGQRTMRKSFIKF
jgi:hypothetical protein